MIESTFSWGTVTGVSPLRVKLDGDAAAIAITPDSLVDPTSLAVTDRVRCEMWGTKLIVLGRGGGLPALPSASDTVQGKVELDTPAEVVLGTDTTRAVTAAGAAAAYKLPARAVRRVMANTNTFTNVTTYGFFPNATDRTAMTISFTKLRADTRILLAVYGQFELGTGVAQLFNLGIRIGSTDYDVGFARFLAGSYRGQIHGFAEVTGLAAGAYTIEPRFKGATTHLANFFASDDVLSYTVQEAF